MTWTIKVSDLYLIEKEKLAKGLLYTGMFLAFLGSLNPWFMWPIGKLYIIPSSMLVGCAMLVTYTMEKDPIFTKKNYLIPMLSLLLFMVYERLSIGSNINGYTIQIFRLVVFFGLFSMSLDSLKQMVTSICKVMGVLLAISIAGHIMYLLGISLPGKSVEFDEYYSYTNHYLFLLDDRNLLSFFPRFNSYFIEPSHIGQACAFLLMAQSGQWKKWYNIILLTTVFLSFSLAAYVYLIIIVFCNQWISRKHVYGKVIIAFLIITIGTIITFTYNKGENMVHDLIMLRLEIDDGKIAGDNRVTSSFQSDYENYIESTDIIFGRKFEIVEFGNSGYKVFFYDHGIVGILLVFLFYFTSTMYTPNKRAFFSVLFITFLYFWATAFMLWENIFFPLYAAAYLAPDISSEDKIDI